MRLFLLFLITALIHGSFSYKAIVFTFHDSGSHQKSISKLFTKLAEDGFEVSVFDTTSKTLPNYGHKNIRIIDGRTTFIPVLTYNISEMIWKSFPDTASFVQLYFIGDQYLKSLIEEKPEIVSEVLNDKYDIVILGDIFSTHGLWFAETLKRSQGTPYILYGTTLQFHAANSALGFGRHYLSRPYLNGDLTKKGKEIYNLNSFWTRFSTFQVSFFEHFALDLGVNFVVPTLRSLGVPNFDFSKFHTDSSFFMSETFDRLGFPLAEVPDFKGVGPHCPEVGPLPPSLEPFVNDPTSKGTIFVALGSHAKWNFAPAYLTEAFFGALTNLSEYRFIFSYNGKFRNVPKHIKILEWSPQKEILNHPKTKIFISHSGLKSTTEAICAAIPIIFMPIYAEQKANSQYMTYFGHSESLDKFTVTASDIIEAVHRIESRYDERKQNMEKLKRIYLDRVINPMDEASFYVTKVIKVEKEKKGKLPFRRISMNQSWFIFFNFDILLLIFVFVFIVAK